MKELEVGVTLIIRALLRIAISRLTFYLAITKLQNVISPLSWISYQFQLINYSCPPLSGIVYASVLKPKCACIIQINAIAMKLFSFNQMEDSEWRNK